MAAGAMEEDDDGKNPLLALTQSEQALTQTQMEPMMMNQMQELVKAMKEMPTKESLRSTLREELNTAITDTKKELHSAIQDQGNEMKERLAEHWRRSAALAYEASTKAFAGQVRVVAVSLPTKTGSATNFPARP